VSWTATEGTEVDGVGAEEGPAGVEAIESESSWLAMSNDNSTEVIGYL
jgi:hypothetical protein